MLLSPPSSLFYLQNNYQEHHKVSRQVSDFVLSIKKLTDGLQQRNKMYYQNYIMYSASDLKFFIIKCSEYKQCNSMYNEAQ